MSIVASRLNGSSGLSYWVGSVQPDRWSAMREFSQARAMQSPSTLMTGMPDMGQGPGVRGQGSGVRGQGSGVGVQGSGFRGRESRVQSRESRVPLVPGRCPLHPRVRSVIFRAEAGAIKGRRQETDARLAAPGACPRGAKGLAAWARPQENGRIMRFPSDAAQRKR
jgi:hypothetical protein